MLTEEILIPERRGLRRWLVIVAVAGALVAATGAVLWRTVQSSTPAQAYLTVPAQRAELAETVAATGPIVAATAVPLNFKSSGKLAQIDVRVGDTVTPGQHLARLDPTDLQTQLRQAQANLAAAQASYDRLKQGLSPADVAAAQAAVNAARAQLAAARQNLAAAQAATAKDVAAAQQAVANAQQALADAQRAAANAQRNFEAMPSVIQQQLADARNSLWSQQINRDAVCGRGNGPACDAANAQVAAAETAIDQANAQAIQQTRQGQAQVDQAQAQVNQAQASLKTAQANLASVEARAAQTVQSAQAQVDAAASAVQTAQAAYNQRTAPPTQAELDAARAQVAAQQAAVELAQANLDSATLVAPSAGVVTAINGAVGQWLTGGSTSGAAASAASGANTSSTNGHTSFISLTDLSALQVQAQVNEADVGRLKPGQPVTFTVGAFPGQTFKGTVAVVQPLGATSQNVVSYPVLISIEPTQARLLPGMTASVTVTVDRRSDVLVVPAAALSFAQAQAASASPAGATASATGPAVLVVDDAGKATRQPLQVGASDGQSTEVVSGLTPGQRVAIGVQG